MKPPIHPAPLRVAVNVRFLLPGDKLEGIGRYTYEVVSRLVAAHPEVQFHFLFDRAYDSRYLFGPNVVPHVLLPPARHPLLWYLWFEATVAWWLRQHRPAAFLSFDGFTTLNTRVPRLTVTHDLVFEHFPLPGLKRYYYHYFAPRFARQSEHLLAVSETTKADLVQTYGIEAGKITVAPNAPASIFRPLPAVDHKAVRAQFAAGEAYFLFVGALHPRKNLVNLLRAFDQFKSATGSATKLVLVGRWAWDASEIARTYEGLHHKGEVLLTGRVSDADLARLYGAARATCYVPLFEGFGLPVVEAQACGSPVLTSDCSSLPEAAGPGGALLVPPTDVLALSQALARLDQDASLRQALVQQGFVNCQRFAWERSAAIAWQVLTDLLAADR